MTLTALLGAALLVGPTVPEPAAAAAVCPEVERIDAGDEVARAAALSQRLRPEGAGTVVVARADDHADGLAGGPLAAALDAPILLTAADELSGATAAEVTRLGARRAVLLGGPEALAPAVEEGLRAAGAETVERYAGADRFATAALIAPAVTGGAPATDVFLAAGSSDDPSRGWPDAVAASALAAQQGRPILLTAPDALPQATSAALTALGTARVTVVGGPVAVAEAVEDAVRAGGQETERTAGGDRYGTSRALAEDALDAGADADPLLVVTGAHFADALAAGPAAAREGGVLLLAGDAPWQDNALGDFVADHWWELDRAFLIGSPDRVPEFFATELCTARAAPEDGRAAPALRSQPAPPAQRRLHPPTAPRPGVRFITPQGAGRRDGSSWADAARLPDLTRLVDASAPGDEVWIHAGLGPYLQDRPIAVDSGGAPGRPVVVRGVAADGSDSATPVIVGSRTAPYSPRGRTGKEVFRLLSGANHLRFENLAFRNQGSGCFRVAGDLTDLTITGMTATNVRRFFENYASGDAPTATVRGLRITDVRVRGFSKGAIRLRYDSSDVLIEDVFGDSERQDHDNFSIGVSMDGTVHAVTLRRVTMVNSHQSQLRGYWNGDGFTAEREVYDLRFEDTYSGGHTDGGYDLKSASTTLLRTVAEGSKRNYRFWGSGITARDCLGLTPWRRGGSGTQAQVHVTGGGTATVAGCHFRDADPQTVVFEVDERATLTVSGGSVQHSPDARLSKVQRGSRADRDGRPLT